MHTRRERYRLQSIADHLRSHDDDLDAVHESIGEVDAYVRDELKALRRALIAAAISFALGFPTLGISIYLAAQQITGG